MNARDIQRALMRDRFREAFVLHNYTPKGWWECDVIEITKGRRFREYEVKLTAKDFKADAAKERVKHELVENPNPTGDRDRHIWEKRRDAGKQEILACLQGATERLALPPAKYTPPAQFWYVVPDSLAPRLRLPGELPDWAGLIVAEPAPCREDPHRVRLSDVVPAPLLHKEKLPEDVLDHARSVTYYRMHSLFSRGRFLNEKDVV